MKNFFLALLFLTIFQMSFKPLTAQDNDRQIQFPDVPGYQTLVCDLHMHTVFSDGSVWPDIRVMEADKDGLDAISLTEHLEYQPRREDIPHPDRNRVYELARHYASGKDLIVINGSEITRRMPPGHANAIFLKDANELLGTDSLEVFQKAGQQGAFVFWNHPHWTAQKPDGIASLTEFHKELIKNNLIHGIEVVNEKTYSDEALQIALDHNLCILGNSDIHGLTDWHFGVPEGGHRPVTLVFAEENTAESLKSALFDGRTVVWFNNLLIGKEANLKSLLNASVKTGKAFYKNGKTLAQLEIENLSDAEFILQNKTTFAFHGNADVIVLPPHSVMQLQVKTKERLEEIPLTFDVLNAIKAPGKHQRLDLNFTVQVH